MIEPQAYVLAGPQRGAALSGAALEAALAGEELVWVHIQLADAEPEPVRDWIARVAPGLDSASLTALTGASGRPRVVDLGRGALVILRDTLAAPARDIEDMPSIRLYLTQHLVLSLAPRPSPSLEREAGRVARGQGATTIAGFLHNLFHALADHGEERTEALSDRVDRLEDETDGPDVGEPERREATVLRRTILDLRRSLAPQRDVIDAMRALEMFGKPDRRTLSDAHDRNVHAVETLDLLAHRLDLTRDAIAGAQAERLNRHLYVLSIVSVLFLPLGFLTGLMGVNLGGLPGAEHPHAFWWFCGLLAAVVAGLAIVLWRIRWFR